jgi:peptidoglycan hydrolase-like protein with peptidoglycan-binding domain
MTKRAPLRGLRVLAIAGALSPMALTTTQADARFGDHALRGGSHGQDVRVLQRWLTRVGITTRVDGSFGPGTGRSVRRYERRFGLRVDGVVSPAQAAGLRKRAAAATGVGAGSGRATAGASSGVAGGAEVGVAVPRSGAATTDGARAVLSADGRTALAPAGAPQAVKDVIAAANRIVDKPYHYGGGHGRWEDSGYDCSGAVSYALHGGGLIDAPQASGALESWGRSGRGTWITVHANGGHAYAIVAGLRFDTSGPGERGPRWRPAARSSEGFVARHPAGF